MRTTLKYVFAALAIGCLAGAAAPALGQTPIPAAATSGLTEDWLIGEWHAAREEDLGTTSALTYWIDLKIQRRPDGKLEAVSTARQMADADETSTWKSDVVINGDKVLIKFREKVGKPEWASYVPDNFELRRLENRLIGNMSSRWWIIDMNHLVQFMR